MDLALGSTVQLTDSEGDDAAPSWSPDGSHIAFMSDRDGDFEIYAVDLDGTNVTQLTDNLSSGFGGLCGYRDVDDAGRSRARRLEHDWAGWTDFGYLRAE